MKRIFFITLLVLSGDRRTPNWLPLPKVPMLRYTLTLRRSVAMESW